jgi:Mismatch repair ATPase (MutS family)
VAAEADQQLSLTAALGLAEEPQPAPEPGPSRPRSRQRQAAPTAPPAPSPSPDSDLPPWHHHGLVAAEQLTPMLRHYVELKAAHPDRVLLYRLGDFFECFFEDAITLSRLLELTLTGKEGGKAVGRVPMAGIPHHSAERYCAELVRRGLSVALCDQLESTPAKGELLKRGITRVLTPGTVLEEGLLAARLNNWLCAVVMEGRCWGLAVADVSTGEFRVTERTGSAGLHQELLQVEAAEVLWPAASPAPPGAPRPYGSRRCPAPPLRHQKRPPPSSSASA